MTVVDLPLPLGEGWGEGRFPPPTYHHEGQSPAPVLAPAQAFAPTRAGAREAPPAEPLGRKPAPLGPHSHLWQCTQYQKRVRCDGAPCGGCGGPGPCPRRFRMTTGI